MAWTVILDPSEVAIARTELSLNSLGIRVGQAGIDWGEAQITAYQAAEQQWGSRVLSFRVPNRIITIPLGLGMDNESLFETAKTALQQKVARLQAEGGALKRQRGGQPALYADIESATLTFPDQLADTPRDRFGHYERRQDNVTLTLECAPDFYGDMVSLDTISATGETTSVLKAGGVQANVLGDYPGRAQIVLVDGSANQQYGLLWAFRSRNYSPATTAGLAYGAAASLTRAPGAVVSALAGARGGQAISQSGIGSGWKDVAYLTGSHVGSYQVWARVYTGSPSVYFRLGWNIGDRVHGLIANPQAAVPGTAAFYIVNLGQVRIDPTIVGAQQWALAVQAMSALATASAQIDMLWLQPLDESAGELAGGPALSDPVMLASGRLQLRFDAVMRAIAGGAAFSPLVPIGDLPRIPPSGNEARAVQCFLKASRGDLGSRADAGGQDAFSAAVSYRPSYLFP